MSFLRPACVFKILSQYFKTRKLQIKLSCSNNEVYLNLAESMPLPPTPAAPSPRREPWALEASKIQASET